MFQFLSLLQRDRRSACSTVHWAGNAHQNAFNSFCRNLGYRRVRIVVFTPYALYEHGGVRFYHWPLATFERGDHDLPCWLERQEEGGERKWEILVLMWWIASARKRSMRHHASGHPKMYDASAAGWLLEFIDKTIDKEDDDKMKWSYWLKRVVVVE